MNQRPSTLQPDTGSHTGVAAEFKQVLVEALTGSAHERYHANDTTGDMKMSTVNKDAWIALSRNRSFGEVEVNAEHPALARVVKAALSDILKSGTAEDDGGGQKPSKPYDREVMYSAVYNEIDQSRCNE